MEEAAARLARTCCRTFNYTFSIENRYSAPVSDRSIPKTFDYVLLTCLDCKKIADEIEERQRYLLEARQSGVRCEHEERIMAEISQRIAELNRLTPPH